MVSSTLKTHFHDGIYILSFMDVSGYSISCLRVSKRTYSQEQTALILWNKVFHSRYTTLYEGHTSAAASPLYLLLQLMGQTWLSAVWQFNGNSCLNGFVTIKWKMCAKKKMHYLHFSDFSGCLLVPLDCNSTVIWSDCKAETLQARKNNNKILMYSYVC